MASSPLVPTALALAEQASAPSSPHAPLSPFLPGGALAASVPWLSPHSIADLPSGALVRLRGMCVDMFDPEVFVSRFTLNGQDCSALFMSSLPDGAQFNDMNLSERHVVLVRQIPGEASWLRGMRSAPQFDRHAKRANLDEGACVITCLVKSQVPILLHQVVDVVGVLSYDDDAFVTDPDLSSHIGGDVPRLYALAVSPTSLHPGPPYIPDWQGARASLLNFFTNDVLGGDKLAAEFLLMSLVSCVVKRPHEDMPVGKLTLGLTQAKNMSAVAALLENVLPCLMKVEMSPGLLVSKNMIPIKNAQTNRLEPGELQVANGTTVIVDETVLEEGALDHVGLRNVKALQRLATHQTLEYDFGYFTRQQPVDVNVVVLSAGRATLVPVDLLVPLRQGLSNTGANANSGNTLGMMSPARVQECRAFLVKAREVYGTLDLPANVAHDIENAFVTARKNDTMGKINEESLHVWISLARALSASMGASAITTDAFQRAMAMDYQRRLR